MGGILYGPSSPASPSPYGHDCLSSESESSSSQRLASSPAPSRPSQPSDGTAPARSLISRKHWLLGQRRSFQQPPVTHAPLGNVTPPTRDSLPPLSSLPYGGPGVLQGLRLSLERVSVQQILVSPSGLQARSSAHGWARTRPAGASDGPVRTRTAAQRQSLCTVLRSSSFSK